ncbi:MAG: 1-acyl-sn-glycerol-3-phosphate acyltransferase [Clostridia bacterium]|nr:1-acyl-sn-glycerol-3-phosphate acyltransferase [Clostridia bacterium]
MNYFIHKLVFILLRFPVYVFLRIKLNFHRHIPKKIEGPFIVMSNHNTDLDPLLVCSSFRQHMYAVASEHIFRRGFATKLLKFFLDPIARAKGTTATSTVIEMLKRLKKRQNILLFAEGNKSYNGLTNPILPSTGKLVKKAKCSLVTFRLTGGYFTSPRWAKKVSRRGRMDGHVVHVYTPDDLANMTADEVNAAIVADIFEDAYADQEKAPVRYRSDRRAEGIETALFMCPKCKKLGTIQSRGNEFFCDCGLKGEYDEYGYLSGNFDFKTVRDWDMWEQELFKSGLKAGEDKVYYSVDGLKLCSVKPEVGTEIVDSGTLSITGNSLRLGNTEFALSEIEDVSIHGSSALIMTVSKKGYFEIPSDEIKYIGRIFLVAIEELKRQLAEQI